MNSFDKPFLSQLSEYVLSLNVPLEKVLILFPNKRAEVFFRSYLADQISKPQLEPLLMTTDEFMAKVSGISTMSNSTLIFEAYNVYQSLSIGHKEGFQDFLKWISIALYDFNEVDRHLVNADSLFETMESAKALERWELDDSSSTDLIKEYLGYWSVFKPLHKKLVDHCLNIKSGWQGLAFRSVAENPEQIDSLLQALKIEQLVFAGFNALNKAEETILDYLIRQGKSKVIWDADLYYLEDHDQEAGFFINKYRKRWKDFKNVEFWIGDNLKKEKSIQLFKATGSIEQAKVVGSILKDQSVENATKTAVVLSEESLLMPVLNSIPSKYEKVNVTMGLGLKGSSIGSLIIQYFRVAHKLALRKNAQLYFNDLEALLNYAQFQNHFLATNSNAALSDLTSSIKEQNLVYISQSDISDLESDLKMDLSFIRELFEFNDAIEVLEKIKQLILSHLRSNKVSSIEKEIAFKSISTINNLLSDIDRYPFANVFDIAVQLIKEAIQGEEVSFFGEPLEGLQVMGILETRTLDFETVILTSVNEGILPSGKSNNSFIPFDIRRYFGIPVYSERDAIYAYHFYRLLQRAKNINIIYGSGNKGVGGKEQSRFIRQIETEMKSNKVKVESIEPTVILNEKSFKGISGIPKTELLIERLNQMADRGFSPTALSLYIKNPIQFYYDRVLGVYDSDDIEETVGYATLGNIVHDVLYSLYHPRMSSFPSDSFFKEVKADSDDMLKNMFEKHFRKGKTNQGKNLLVYQVAKNMIEKFIAADKENSNRITKEGGSISLIGLEEEIETEIFIDELGRKVKFKGIADRIERVNGTVRIVDYKTGLVEPNDLKIEGVAEMFDNDRDRQKAFQLFMYALIYNEKYNEDVKAGIVSLRKLSNGVMEAAFKGSEQKNNSIIFDSKVLRDFKQDLLLKICEMFDMKTDFVDNEVISLDSASV